jgi:hypothetical protein
MRRAPTNGSQEPDAIHIEVADRDPAIPREHCGRRLGMKVTQHAQEIIRFHGKQVECVVLTIARRKYGLEELKRIFNPRVPDLVTAPQ